MRNNVNASVNATLTTVSLGCLCVVRCSDGENACWLRSAKSKRFSNRQPRGREFSEREKIWILALRHATKCDIANGERCGLGNSCIAAKSTCAHLRECKSDEGCKEPLCALSRRLIGKIC